ncbi:CLAVATA3/ESR-RELATED 41 [Arabidopsis thaliana]|uniref:CLAVATA3/ESR (CLE)-related protein 41 n=1 Tax=Arabidopsis thaliana TaxID=3702 RepID=CLE41_ARATH|nr:CLAVATA3/ESR-RELATED 41 [Arabidopsis thaliana]Q84W98.1 RecName: Full=CLAVATA3/ESR (CLE)-related protein 41; AltName: Full=Tracheary element differentiation inhibitory factor-like protein; Short=TDIF-like protein; Contains: RecName: Full=CLE41p; Flags: Precursor [Arabidopsis thaliana]AAO42114.1 putative CLE41 protein [Arabidopsis thaliana]AAW70406.1 At3g24770 [Arabidopsis thaliana]AEE76945.1 CLAVATA3/ESR-RELATED 41 [Arabidopsis thaliana]|eukprot:NP_566754.1 CLAVATA3/ESR-RELATED 41 [Arabidopsis thaliana]
MATSNDQTNTKSSHSRTLLLLFIFLSLLLFSSLTIPMTRHQSTSMVAPFKRVLLESSVPASSTMDLRPKASTRRSRTSRRREFGNDAHEVPSGPNPISN